MTPCILVGCGSANEALATNDNGDTIITVGQQTQPNSKLPKGDTYENNAYRRLVNEKLGVELQSAFEATGDDYSRQVSLAIASGDIPDVMTVSRDELEELAENDLIADLSEVYEKYASKNIKSIYSSFDNIQLEAATIDGKLMALPGTANDFGPNLVWIRQDWLDRLGIVLDKDGNQAITLEELKSTAKAFKEKDAGGTGKTQGLAFASWLSSDSHGGSAYTASPIFNAFDSYPKMYFKNASGTIEYGSTQIRQKIL
ncbi:extracellular solute-binding protein [Streptococcus cuniculi]|uniref:extracellular solute-binding protein n=1 Tax=Streptococcus cuniculi TaxID=1432788 RepID=UPI001D16A882|nr:extracellular solute-binding protein [Streptococcus cuniculi]